MNKFEYIKGEGCRTLSGKGQGRGSVHKKKIAKKSVACVLLHIYNGQTKQQSISQKSNNIKQCALPVNCLSNCLVERYSWSSWWNSVRFCTQIQRHYYYATFCYDVMTSFDSRDGLPRCWLLHSQFYIANFSRIKLCFCIISKSRSRLENPSSIDQYLNDSGWLFVEEHFRIFKVQLQYERWTAGNKKYQRSDLRYLIKIIMVISS